MKPTLIFFPDGTQIDLEKEKLVQISSKRFLEVSKNKTWKFQLLPNWLNSVSYWYSKENNKILPLRYFYYDRGSIIRVDFGVNMGSEFCGLHFAIVLDKNDISSKKTLTVIPLTSKSKKGRFSLGKEIFNQTTNILNQQISELEKRIVFINQKTVNLEKKTKFLAKKLKNIILNGTDEREKDIVNKEFQYVINKGIVTDTLNNIIINGKYNENEVNQLKNEIKDNGKEFNQLKNEARNNSKEIQSLIRVIKIYSRYNKNTYVRLSDITTISKLRIRKINKYDPSGKIKLNSQQMASISDELMNLYITKNNS